MSEPNVYLCLFRDVGKDHFVTDCAFDSDQLERAQAYVEKVVIGLADVAEGKVWNAKTRSVVYEFGNFHRQEQKKKRRQLHLMTSMATGKLRVCSFHGENQKSYSPGKKSASRLDAVLSRVAPDRVFIDQLGICVFYTLPQKAGGAVKPSPKNTPRPIVRAAARKSSGPPYGIVTWAISDCTAWPTSILAATSKRRKGDSGKTVRLAKTRPPGTTLAPNMNPSSKSNRL